MSELPQGWEWSTLGNLLAKIDAGRSFQCDPAPPGPDDVGVMKVSAVSWGVYQEAESKTCTDPALVNPDYFVSEGDFLFSRANTIELVGACVIVGRTTRRIMLSDKILRFRFYDRGWSKWILFSLRSADGRREIERLATGNQDSMRNIGQDRVRQIPVLIPPAQTRDRIVAEIEKQLTRLDAAEASLERVKANLRRARASVLQAAVEGRLVPTEASIARAEGRDYEPASVLLARILDERKAKWPKGKKYVEPAISSSPSDGTPSGWSWVTMDQIAWVSGYGTSVKCDHSAGGPPVLRIPNVQKTVIDLTDLKYATESESLKSDGVVAPGDFLFVRTNGSLDLIGRGAMVMAPPPTETWFASYLIRLRLCGTADTWRWISFVWESRIVRRYIERDAASSAGQYNVSLSAAAQYQIPLPPLAEQHRIVAEVERRLTILDSLAATVERRLESCKHLRQSILKRAFEGKLVPQDPNDEPASALLARLPRAANLHE